MVLRKYDSIKRALDLTIAAILVVALLPVAAAVAIIVGLRLGRPILFKQERPGRNEVTFQMFKFRTMSAPGGEVHMTDAQRLTPLGKKLRSASLDELPALVNVLKGDMSLVGPRPLLVDYLELYSPEQRRRHEVRPGITGLAQVKGRNSLSWEERFGFDVDYVDRRSLWLDLKILAMTVITVVKRDGITESGHATMSPFRGSDKVNPHGGQGD